MVMSDDASLIQPTYTAYRVYDEFRESKGLVN